MGVFGICFFQTRSCLGAELAGVPAFKHDRVWKVSCPETFPNMVVFGAVWGRAWWRFWACFLALFFGGRFGSVFWRLWASLFWGRCCGGAAAGVAPVRCAASFFRRGLVRWGGAVRGVRALRGCASCPVCARPGRFRRRVCVCCSVFFGCAWRWRAAVAGAARAAFFFLRARGVPPRAVFLFRFFVLFFCLFCFVFTSAPCRCVSVSVVSSPLALHAASLFSFSAALKKSLKFFYPVFKQGP